MQLQRTEATSPPGEVGAEVSGPAEVTVSVAPRQRVRYQADIVRVFASLVLLGAGVLIAMLARNTLGGAEEDIVDVYERVPEPLADALATVAVVSATFVPVGAVIVLLLRRHYHQAGAFVLGAGGAIAAMNWLGDVLTERGVVAAVDPETDRVVELSDPVLATSPLIAAAVALVVIASPRLSRQWNRVLWLWVGVLILLRVVSSAEPPLDIVIAVALGMVVGYLARLAFGTESADPDGDELLTMLGPVVDPVRVEQLEGDGPLRYAVELADGESLLLRLRTRADRSAELLEQLWRTVRLRTSQLDEPYSTVQRRVEHEALAQAAAGAGGVRVPRVRAIVASSSGSVGLVEEGIAGTPAAELPAERLDQRLLREVWRHVAALHRHRIAHRALGLHAVTVTEGGQAVVGEFDAARLAASDRDLALDRAQLLVDTALRVGPDEAVAVAVEVLGPRPVVAAVPYLQALALPPATRRELRGNKEVLDAVRETVEGVTGVEPAPLARLERVRPRTAVSIVALAGGFYFLLPQLANVGETADAAAEANWWFLGPIFVGAGATFFSAALSLLGSVPQPISYLATVRMQVAAAFVGRIAPANTGSLAVGVRFLQRSGVDTATAGAAVGLNAVVGAGVHLSLTAAFLAWAGTRGPGFSLPDANAWLLGIAAAGLVSGIVVAGVPALRRRVVPPLLDQLRTAGSSLADVITDPLRVLALVGGALGITFSFILTLTASAAAFGGDVSFPEVGAAYLVAAAIGSATPTPGGLGAVEAALVAALTGYGMPSGHAVSAVLTFRLATYWAPMIPGWILFHQMQRREEL
ncbi:MAG TPA: lysylphosphatidylglycerol synthase transmembrane domain-containing protein [Acidimicrobiales bacterium]|nr:lysylphosphatidylglycerol synthase transmembrane domain-containing protein [Acidimicrobiales bacterium]